MKSFKSIALFIALSQIISIAYSSTPKADGLADHYGTEPTKDIYGPHANKKGFFLRREGVGPGGPFTQIDNYNQQIKNSEVVAGDLTNASYDASKIINPKLASKIYFFINLFFNY